MKKHCAVLIPLVWQKDEMYLLLEVRSGTVSQPGEICFPGGGVEKKERPMDCVVRETQEETGIPKHAIRILGQFDKAAEDIAIAATFDVANPEVLQQRAMLATEQRNLEEALNHYNEAIMYCADDASLYLLRGDTYAALGDAESAMRNYTMMLNVQEEEPAFDTLRGFAMARMGQNADAEVWMEQVMMSLQGVPTSDDYYKAACLYAHTGNFEQAYNYLEQALKAGYGDYFNLYFEYDSPISLAPLRNEPAFRELIKSYREMF